MAGFLLPYLTSNKYLSNILVGCLPQVIDIIIISNIAKEMQAPKHRNNVSIIIRTICYVRLEENMPTYWIKKDRTSFNDIWEVQNQEVLLFHFFPLKNE